MHDMYKGRSVYNFDGHAEAKIGTKNASQPLVLQGSARQRGCKRQRQAVRGSCGFEAMHGPTQGNASQTDRES